MMNVLVIGGGGREHALVWKLKQSPRVAEIFCAPGNAGIAELAKLVPIPIHDHAALIAFARQARIDLTVVGPDDALAAGIVDAFEQQGLRIFGPRRAAAKLEFSKAFAKEFMVRHAIPTARSATFSDSDTAHRYCQRMRYPVVIKADGLALGKGVLIAESPWSAAMAIHEIMERGRFGEAGRTIVVEEFLHGEECSIHALVDGGAYLLFPGAQDHKRIGDDDRGPNTGGMGAFSPPDRLLTADMLQRVRSEILDRVIAGMQADGIDFRGMLFPGLMLTADGPKVLEFNCRFGDPETQVLLPRLQSDLLDLLEATIDRRLVVARAEWHAESAVCVVLASAGYPGPCNTGKRIDGLKTVPPDVLVFHAGTKRDGNEIVTAGGRVLGISALGADLRTARARAYRAVEQITFAGCHFRTDIAAKGIAT
jgi:phosphoribosylamine--glycine ligase